MATETRNSKVANALEKGEVQMYNYSPSYNAGSDDPAVTVQKSGSLSMNRAAYGMLDSTKRIRLGYIHDANAIYIRPVIDEDERPYQGVGYQGKNASTARVNAHKFLDTHKIDYSVARRYPVERVSAKGLPDGIVLYLDDSVGDVSRG